MTIRQQRFIKIIAAALFAFSSTSLQAQLWLDAKFGMSRNSFFEFKDDHKQSEGIPNTGQYAMLGLSHNLKKNIRAFYKVEWIRFRAGSVLEQGQGRSTVGHDLRFEADYLATRLGLEQYIFGNASFQVSGSFAMVLGYQLRNRTTGSAWQFKPTTVYGPDEEPYTVRAKETKNFNGETYEKVNSYFFGTNLGVLLSYNLSERLKLQSEIFYAFTFTPFLEHPSPRLLRHGLNAGLGISYKLSKD